MTTETQLTLIQSEPQRSPPALTPLQLIQMATERGADVATLERLMTLNERWEATEARKAYIVAVSAFKSEPLTITKNKLVSFGGKGGTAYHHATLDHICEAVVPALSAHGLSHRWETDQNDGMIRVTCVLTHILGHSERVTLQSGADTSGSKNNIQAIASATTYLCRYTLLMITGLATGDMDDDARSNADFVTADQVKALRDLAKSVNADEPKFLAYVGADSFETIPGKKFDMARGALQRKAAK